MLSSVGDLVPDEHNHEGSSPPTYGTLQPEDPSYVELSGYSDGSQGFQLRLESSEQCDELEPS